MGEKEHVFGFVSLKNIETFLDDDYWDGVAIELSGYVIRPCYDAEGVRTLGTYELELNHRRPLGVKDAVDITRSFLRDYPGSRVKWSDSIGDRFTVISEIISE